MIYTKKRHLKLLHHSMGLKPLLYNTYSKYEEVYKMDNAGQEIGLHLHMNQTL